MAQAQCSNVSEFQPRKFPKQERSRKLFDKILKCAAELFYSKGFANVTTNHIADAADISVGSLYQYFGSCESIALAVYEAASVRAIEQMAQKARDIHNLPTESALEEIIHSIFEIFQRDQYVLLQLINEVPELREAAKAVSFDNLIHDIAKEFVALHRPELSDSELEKTVYLLEKLNVGTIRSYLEDLPGCLSSEELIAELVSVSRCHLGVA